MPAETCSPWQPTSVKNADRNALRVGPAPRATRLGEFPCLDSEKGKAQGCR